MECVESRQPVIVDELVGVEVKTFSSRGPSQPRHGSLPARSSGSHVTFRGHALIEGDPGKRVLPRGRTRCQAGGGLCGGVGGGGGRGTPEHGDPARSQATLTDLSLVLPSERLHWRGLRTEDRGHRTVDRG